MKSGENWRKSFGLFRHISWKKRLLAAAIGFLICLLLERLTILFQEDRFFSAFDPTLAVVPLIGFLMGIWGILGCLAEISFSLVDFLRELDAMGLELDVFYAVMVILSMAVYCVLPSLLWYHIPIKGEKLATYPRLDTSAHVIKYYLIMIVTVFVYLIMVLFMNGFGLNGRLLDYVVIYTQYLNAALILGIPVILVLSAIYHRTFTINERMVLSFLVVGVAAALISAWVVYRFSAQLNPAVFEDYEALMLHEELEFSEEEMDIINRYNNYWDWFYVMVAIVFNSLLILEMFLMRSIEKKVTQPILGLADAMEKYAGQGGNGLSPEALREECGPYRYGYGEVSSLTRTCVDMAGEVDTYMKNLQEATAEKERIGTELKVASSIQSDMLPRAFPPFPERREIDLYASMTPAREVGGDFYDFYLVDRDHLALTIADVSGKGVPAALFMVIAKTLLQNHAQLGGSPKEILAYVNHQLCQNNESLMFCTVWLGILDLNTGKLVSANAGHEYPAVRKKGGSYELMIDKHSPPLGVREGVQFREREDVLAPGDSLFVYTDGVTEGTNASLEEFGEERLVLALNEDASGEARDVVERVHRATEEFAGGTPQFDDITLLCLRYLGPEKQGEEEKKQSVLVVPADNNELDRVMAFAEEHLEAAGCSEDALYSITLAVEEVFSNIANYAYGDNKGSVKIAFSFNEEDRQAVMEFSDRGIPFDPTRRPEPDITAKPSERPIGGLGIFIVRKTMDEVKYRYEGGKNVLTIRKSIE